MSASAKTRAPVATQQDLRTAEWIRDTILSAAGPSVERIVFHGSRANGRARPSSDFDVLVVVRASVTDWAGMSLRLSDLFNRAAHPVDVQGFGWEEFQEARPVAGTLPYSADQRGILLYASPAAAPLNSSAG